MLTATLVSEFLVDARFRCRLIRLTLLDWLGMASIGPGRYVVVVLHVGGSKLTDIKLVLQREPSTGKTLFPVDSISSNEKHVGVLFLSCMRKLALY
jgi:hypothetical protein